MTIAERQEQIIRIHQAQRVQPELGVQLEASLRQAVMEAEWIVVLNLTIENATHY
jgi:hypothetical protein